jgi:hypothetical protein
VFTRDHLIALVPATVLSGTRPSKRRANWFIVLLQWAMGIVQRRLMFFRDR